MSVIPESLGLDLRLGEISISIPTIASFEFALAGRTSLPAPKIAKLIVQPDDALLREAEAIRRVEQRLTAALSGALEDVTNVGSFLANIDHNLISQDHEWRTIIDALNGIDDDFEPYKRVALVKYLQYLAARQETIRSIYANRQISRQEAFGGAGNANEDLLKETVLIDLTLLAENGADAHLQRMPKGETVALELDAGESIELLLAKHRCTIVAGKGLVFVDGNAEESTIRRGRNLIGRDTTCDIALDAGLRDVSRKHLIIDSDGERAVSLTDISSHGCFIHARFLDRSGS